MPTLKQRRLAKGLAEAIVNDEKISVSKIIEKAGYSNSIAYHHQKEIVESRGTQEALKTHGFDLLETDNVVRGILLNGEKEETKLRAADIVYKRIPTGYAATRSESENKNFNANLNLDLTAEQKRALELAAKFEAELNSSLEE